MKLEQHLNEVKKPQLLTDLLDIHMTIDNVKSYIGIQLHIEDLEKNYKNDKNYKELQRITKLLLKVLKGFAKGSDNIKR